MRLMELFGWRNPPQPMVGSTLWYRHFIAEVISNLSRPDWDMAQITLGTSQPQLWDSSLQEDNQPLGHTPRSTHAHTSANLGEPSLRSGSTLHYLFMNHACKAG